MMFYCSFIVLEALVPEPKLQEKLDSLSAASEHVISYGITSIHDAGVSPENAMIYRE
jgi:predicted amidohydrolase YtcJ